MVTGFPIVGIGASAGGLAATTELVRHLGEHPGIGVVIVHHLDPTHQSGLAEIFGRATPMPVQTATDGIRVQANHVYVVPPNAGLLLVHGRLNLTPRVQDAGLHLPIDRFLESLAADRGASSLAVLLSGSGSDGSSGIQAIKAAGGITFAQDSAAEFRSMPANAIATGCIDFVLSPAAIALELTRIGATPPITELDAVPSEADDPAFQRLLVAMHKASGVDFANYKHATIRRRVQRRVFLRRMRDLEEYVVLVEQEPGEASALCEEVLIHVTGFFRDKATFEALETRVFPKLLEQRSRAKPIRIWVAGCSSGEEVYSLAISLLEFLARADSTDVPINIFGTDVSGAAIERARSGRYPEGIAEDVSPERLIEFFSKQGAVYQIRKDVRDACVFARHDATRDPPFSGMDIVSCRNLMIYLGAALQQRMLSIFHYALRQPGFLVLGSAETVHSFAGFSIFDEKSKIYQRSSAAARLTFDFSSPALPDPVDPSAPTKSFGPLDIHREADRLVLAKFAPPGMLVTDDLAIVQFRGKTAPYLEPAPGAASFDLLCMVREELRLPLRRAVDEAREKRTGARRAGVRLQGEGGVRVVDIDVVPLAVAAPDQRHFVVLFRDVTTEPVESPAEDTGGSAVDAQRVHELENELASTREYLESVIERLGSSNEELTAANEEITSSNEELRSTNEELQMAKEEIQATNEELHTVNDEMAVRNTEATRLSDDLTNVLRSVDIPIVFLGRDSAVRRFAPAAGRVLGLTPADLGRPIGELQGRLVRAGAEMAESVIRHLTPVERTLQDDAGCWYQLLARPYLTVDSRIDGTVLAAFDIDAMKKATDRLAEAQRERAARALERSESDFRDVLTTAAEGIIMAEASGRIVFANPAVVELFGFRGEELLGQFVQQLVPVDSSDANAKEEAQEVDPPTPGRGQAKRDLMLRRKDGSALSVEVAFGSVARESGDLIVYFVTDVSARREAERRITEYQEKLRQMAFDAAVAEERERRRIASDLHDRIGQALALSQMKLKSVQKAGAGLSEVSEAIDLLGQSIVDTRTLIFDLSPPILYDLGLAHALSWLAEDLGKRWGIRIEIQDDHAPKPFGDATLGLVFRAVRELCTNVLKHARAPTAVISLRRNGDHVEIDVEDSGVGFNPDTTTASAREGFGLFSVREQISRLGGTVAVESAEQRGTRVRLRLPLDVQGPKPKAEDLADASTEGGGQPAEASE